MTKTEAAFMATAQEYKQMLNALKLPATEKAAAFQRLAARSEARLIGREVTAPIISYWERGYVPRAVHGAQVC